MTAFVPLVNNAFTSSQPRRRACIMVRVTATHWGQGCGASPSHSDSERPSRESSRQRPTLTPMN
jgi:hypothetical protein